MALSLCQLHRGMCAKQGDCPDKSCPGRPFTLYTEDGGESVDTPLFTTGDAFDWTQTILVAAFCGVCLAAVVAPFIFG